MENLKTKMLEVISAESDRVTNLLNEAKMKFANAHLNEEDWSARSTHERNCQIYKGQKEILERMANKVVEIGE